MEITPQGLYPAGLTVFPLRENKTPAVKSWQTRREPGQYHWPTGKYGLLVPAYVVIFDFDIYKNPSVMAQVEAALGTTGLALQKTPSGGVHAALYCDRPIKQGANLLGIKGFDIRSAGKGYIATGEGYEPVGMGVFQLAYPENLPRLPDAAAERLAPPPPVAPAPLKEFDGHANPAAMAALERWAVRLENMPEGGRNDVLNKGAYRTLQWAYAGDLDPGPCKDRWLTAALASGLDEGPAVATIASADRAARNKPRKFDSRINVAAAFGPEAAPIDVFSALVDRAQESGGDIKQLEAILAEIQSAGCNELQRATLGAELKNALRDAGIKDKSVADLIDRGLKSRTPIDVPSSVVRRSGSPIMSPAEQAKHFAGCVYVREPHKVRTPDGALLKPEQFNASLGGYAFVIADDGKTTRKAFECFTESQMVVFPQADSGCFRPELPPGQIITESGRQLVNTYVPAMGEQVPGDVTPFLDHVARILPSEADREIALSYLAACVQLVGKKFQWAPVVQGVEGNGKSLLSRCASKVVGERYVHYPNAADITSRFNGWLEGKLLIVIEEMKTAGRQEVADILKPMITNDRIEVQGKGQDQRTADNRANFLIFSNHPDAVLKTASDRRYCVLFTAQQGAGDLIRDGMTDQYFAGLYGWLENGGYAHVAHYLATRPITVDVMGRAPVTSSTAEAIRSSAGVAEQLIQEGIELDEWGFRGDLVCTKAASDHLLRAGKRLGPQRVVEVLASLGYVKHPALEGSAGKIQIDGVRRRLYVRRASLAASLTTAAAVADHWRRVHACPTGSGLSKPLDGLKPL